jgi:uncharacterized protein (TIGR02599 family)
MASRRSAFTLVEMMVSTSILALVMLMLLSTVDQTQKIWTRSTSKVSQFQSARAAFEAMTRNLSQATLNTYYDVERSTEAADFGEPIAYARASELHFVSGKAAQDKLLGDDTAKFPTHAVFFQAPLGVTSEEDPNAATAGGNSVPVKRYRSLSSTLSAIGYYIEWGADTEVPQFLKTMQQGETSMIPERYRFRLKEVIQPTEALSIYATPDFAPQSDYKKTTDWIQVALGNKAPSSGGSAKTSSWVRAENIVALVLLPKLPERERGNPPGSDPTRLDLAPKYEYDTRPVKEGSGTPLTIKEVHDAAAHVRKQYHQLPPIIQVTMVAIDEPSAMRQQAIAGEIPPPWTEGLFEDVLEEQDYLEDMGEPANPKPNTLVGRLAPADGGPRMNYRIYSADVPVRAAKWSNVD